MNVHLHHLFRATWKSRLVFGAGFLASVIYNQQPFLAFVQLMMAVLLLRWVDGNFRLFRRAAKLLLWITLPMIIIHALFSPGRLIEAGGVPLSVDGALYGAHLALHFITVFIAALLLYRVMTAGEWLRFVTRLPWFGGRLLPYIVLMQPLRNETMAIIRRYRMRWARGERDMNRLGLMLLLIIRRVLRCGSGQAAHLWHNWDAEMARVLKQIEHEAGSSLAASFFWSALAVGCVWLAIRGI